MKKINDGGPAFPADAHAVAGMTLRDYFAAKAMQGMLSSSRDFTADPGEPITTWEEHAKGAYQMADAMLAAREQNEQQS